MALPQIEIIGKVLDPGLGVLPTATLRFRLSEPITVSDGTTNQTIAFDEVITLDANGAIPEVAGVSTLKLVPTAGATPAGAFYHVEGKASVDGKTRDFKRKVQVAATPARQAFADLLRIEGNPPTVYGPDAQTLAARGAAIAAQLAAEEAEAGAAAAGAAAANAALAGKVSVGAVGPEVVTATSSLTARSLANRFAAIVDVRDYGATGDGSIDDTVALQAALDAGGGASALALHLGVRVPAGTYIVNSVTVSARAALLLADGATLKHKTSSTDHMIKFTGTEFRISGGTIDGNRAGQGANRRYTIRCEIPSTAVVDVSRVNFTSTLAAGVYGATFGGTLNVQDCRFEDMAEHDNIAGHWTAAVYVESGESGQRGICRFNRNTLIGTNAPANVGGAPGGLFFAPTLDYANGIGNFSSMEAIGNHFWGIGQNCNVNDIGPIHTYPATDGVRVIGNYFEQCGFSAIAAKSVQNFVCTGNVIVNGQTNAKNIASEGAISYAPGYHSGVTQRPRAVISGNVIDTPGGQATAKQDGISVLGTSTSYATDVVISNNVIAGCGNGVQVAYCENVTISGNRIDGATGGTAGTEYGVRIAQTTGTVQLRGNHITAPNGHGVYALNNVNLSEWYVSDNTIEHSAAATYGVIIRGVTLLKMSGNSITSTGAAVSITTDGTNNVGTLAWDTSNTIVGTQGIIFASIGNVTGHMVYASVPEGSVTAPVGTLYTRTTAGQPALYVKASGTGNTGWIAVPQVAAAQYVMMSTPYFNTANGSVVGRFVYPYAAGARLVDVLVYQVQAGTGGTSWSVTVRNAAGTGMLDTLPVATLASGANQVTDAKEEVALPSGWTRPVIKSDATPDVVKGGFIDVYCTEVGTYSPHAVGIVVLVFAPSA